MYNLQKRAFLLVTTLSNYQNWRNSNVPMVLWPELEYSPYPQLSQSSLTHSCVACTPVICHVSWVSWVWNCSLIIHYFHVRTWVRFGVPVFVVEETQVLLCPSRTQVGQSLWLFHFNFPTLWKSVLYGEILCKYPALCCFSMLPIKPRVRKTHHTYHTTELHIPRQ